MDFFLLSRPSNFSIAFMQGHLRAEGRKRFFLLGVCSEKLKRWVIFCCYSVTQSCPTLCDPMDCSTPGFPVLHYPPEFALTHFYWIGDAIQPSHPLLPPSPPALNLSQHQDLFQCVSSSHQVAKGLELWLQHQSFKWVFRLDWFDLLAVQGTRSFSNWLWKHELYFSTCSVQLLQSCPTLCNPVDVAHHVPLSLGFSRQEY